MGKKKKKNKKMVADLGQSSNMHTMKTSTVGAVKLENNDSEENALLDSKPKLSEPDENPTGSPKTEASTENQFHKSSDEAAHTVDEPEHSADAHLEAEKEDRTLVVVEVSSPLEKMKQI